MSALLKLRDYQTECIKAIHSRWDAGDNRVPSVLATGLGKTVIFSHLGVDYLSRHQGKRVLIIAHTDELIEQAAKKMRQVAPHLSVGIVKAERNQVTAQVIVSSRQTLASERRRAQIRNVGLIVVDECHHAVRNNTYGKILEHFGAFDDVPKCWVVGFTATLIRGDKAKLSEVWQPGKVFTRDINFGIRHGYLLDVKGSRVIVPDFDITKVKKSGGDYQDAALADELIKNLAPEIVAKKYKELAIDRLGIGFAPTVAAAEAFADAFNAEGITSEVIHGKLGKGERAAMLQRLDSGQTRVLWGCMVLTEGFDNPRVSCVIWARPTTLPGLYQQGVGRALRPDLTLPPAERGHALVLDVVGASRQHNLASLIDLSLPDPYDEHEEEDFQDPCVVCMFYPCECPKEEEDGQGGLFDVPQEVYAGPVDVEDFDPLARDSTHAWTKTAGGYYVLTAGLDAYVFLVPEITPGEFGIAWCTKNRSKRGYLECPDRDPYFTLRHTCDCGAGHKGAFGGWSNGHRGLSMEMALAWGIDVAEEIGGDAAKAFGDKKKSWRRSRDISDSQLHKALGLGIVVPMKQDGAILTPDIRKGELNDLINAALATKRVDPVIGALMKQMETVDA